MRTQTFSIVFAVKAPKNMGMEIELDTIVFLELLINVTLLCHLSYYV